MEFWLLWAINVLFILFIIATTVCPLCALHNCYWRFLTLGSLEEFHGFFMRFAFHTLQQAANHSQFELNDACINFSRLAFKETQFSFSKLKRRLLGLKYNVWFNSPRRWQTWVDHRVSNCLGDPPRHQELFLIYKLASSVLYRPWRWNPNLRQFSVVQRLVGARVLRLPQTQQL